MTDDVLRAEQRGSVRWLYLNRPRQRNALNEEVTAALEVQVASIEADPATSVVVITGEGSSFCAGGDFRHFLASGDDGVVRFLTRLSACVTRIEHSSKPWIAALHGHAIAGGLELALACDVVIAAEDTMVGDGHLNNRLLPAAGSSVRLERAVGRSTARWMHLSGEPQPVTSLTGWIREVVAPARLRERAQELAERLAALDAGAQQNMKRLLLDVEERDADAALRLELDAFADNWTQRDVPDALARFLATRSAPTERVER